MEEHTELMSAVQRKPYGGTLRLKLAASFRALGYPDLAAGEAYMGLLLSDEIQDDCGEYHCMARDAAVADMQATTSELDGDALISWATENIELPGYSLLATCLQEVGCLREAHEFLTVAIRKFPDSREIQALKTALDASLPVIDDARDGKREYPNKGSARRHLYPWNTHEPDRYSPAFLDEMNGVMSQFAPNLEIKVTSLPNLKPSNSKPNSGTTTDNVQQLGVFAKCDLAPGEIVLDEKSLVTATSRINDPFCDACGKRLEHSTESVMCSECDEAVFCSAECLDRATVEYHPAVCGIDLSSLSRGVHATEAADSLYALLVFRCLAMACQQSTHPLDLPSIKCIWADFDSPTTPSSPNETAKHLPWSFRTNVLLPLNMLEKTFDVSSTETIFTVPWAAPWVFNTLFAKLRGTASARQGLDGLPEIGAVHAMWCMANHSCAPNVGWEWDGSMRFTVREETVRWGPGSSPSSTEEEESKDRGECVIRKGEEVLSHYCDVTLPVRERREWAAGALGGMCKCPRCLYEAAELPDQ